MMRGATILWGILAAVAGTGLFMLKYEVQAQEQRLTNLRKEIADTQESIHVLKAEWSYLNDPSRLREQAERHLGLHPLKPSQIATIASLPMADPQAPALASEQQPAVAAPEPQPAPIAASPVQPIERHKPAAGTGRSAPAPLHQPAKSAAGVTTAKPAAPQKVATAKPASHQHVAPTAVATNRPAPSSHTVVVPTVTATPARAAANVMVIKSPIMAEPEMASTRAKP